MSLFCTPPPRIIYSLRPKHYAEIIAAASANIRLSERATALLQFYADQASGFAPALKLIEEKTGIRSDNISLVRKQLVDHNLIEYSSRKHFIRLLFEHIQAFSMLTISTGKTLKKSESTNLAYFRKNTMPLYDGDTIKQIIEEHTCPYPCFQIISNEKPQLSKFMQSWINKAEKMTEAEYIDKVRCLPGYKPSLQKPMIEWEIYSECDAFLAT